MLKTGVVIWLLASAAYSGYALYVHVVEFKPAEASFRAAETGHDLAGMYAAYEQEKAAYGHTLGPLQWAWAVLAWPIAPLLLPYGLDGQRLTEHRIRLLAARNEALPSRP
jgi:hypothetical protein